MVLIVYEMGVVATFLNACRQHYERASCLRESTTKGSNGLLSTIPILNVFGRLEEKQKAWKRRDTEGRETEL